MMERLNNIPGKLNYCQNFLLKYTTLYFFGKKKKYIATCYNLKNHNKIEILDPRKSVLN